MKSREEIESGVVRILFKFAVTVCIGLVACGIISLIAGCARKQYIPLQSQSIRVDTVIRIDTVEKTKLELRHDTVIRERTVKVEIRDSIAPRYAPDGSISGYDRYRYEKETDNIRELESRLTQLSDSLRQIATRHATRQESSAKEIALPVKEKCLTKWWLVPLLLAAALILYRRITQHF